MIFDKNTVALYEMENAYGAFEGGVIKLYWYSGGGIRAVTLNAAGEAVSPVKPADLYCDQYAFAPGRTVMYEDGLYKIT